MPKRKEISFAPDKTVISLSIENIKAVKRVLRLVDWYISTKNTGELLAWNGGMMTWLELQQQLRAANRLLKTK